jgi:hypothetical protein
MFLDVTWDNPAWIQPLSDLRLYTRQRNMRLGWYFNAATYITGDANWLNNAARNIEYVEGTLHVVPDIGIIDSWAVYPAHNLPETWPVGLTSLINHYFRERTALAVQFVGRGARGKLTTTQGKPMANVTVNGYVPGVDFTQPLPTTVFQDVVPPNATLAVIGYRLNAECNCHGSNDVLVGQLHYQETSGGSTDYRFLFPDVDQTFSIPPNTAFLTNERVAGVRVNRVIVKPTQSFLPNSSWIPVTPGAHFTYTVPAASMGTGPWHGFVFLNFFDSNYGYVSGMKVVPDGGRVLVSSTATAADGSFALGKLPRVGPGSARVSVEFGGDETHRPVAWSPQW